MEPDHVPHSDHALDRRAASRDLWPGGTLAMWQGEDAPRPGRVWWPESEADVHAVLQAASAQGRVIVPYGAGSGVCGGARGREGSWVIDTKRLDHIGPVDEARWMVEAGAGVNGQHLEDALAAQGYTLRHSPSSLWCSTVGGWAAARGAGQFSSRYGVFEDMVLGLDVVTPAQGPMTVGWPGPDSPTRRAPADWLPQLLGSEGTLGVITRVRMRVQPVPSSRWLRGYRFDDVASALTAMRALMQAELWPAVVRLYDPLDTLIGGKTRPKRDPAHRVWWKDWLAAVDRLPAVRRHTLTLPLSLPGFLRRLGERFTRGCLLIVGFEGTGSLVEASATAARALLDGHGTDLGSEPGERWWASRHAVSYKLMPIFERGGFVDTMEVAAGWDDLQAVYEAVRRAVSPHAFVMAHMSHAYPEGCCIYFSFAGRGDRAVYEALWDAAQRAVLLAGGTVTHHHGVGELKAPYALAEVGAAVQGHRALAAILDPEGLLNPGRVFPETSPGDDPPPPGDVGPDARDAVEVPVGTPLDRIVEAAHPDEPLWAWARAVDPPRGQREAWQSTWLSVSGTVQGERVTLGRAPRSAAGPDLRRWLATHGEDIRVTVATTSVQGRWMGTARVDSPWRVAQRILRAGLRPAVLGVDGGVLHVGFRGPAAEALGGLAAECVPGGLEVASWRLLPRPVEALVPCDPDDPEAVSVTTQTAWRPARAGEDWPREAP